jgi:hypothetical protein
MGRTAKGWRSAFGAALLAAAIASCAGRYGAIRFDAAAGRMFEAAEVLPGHRYYSTGSELSPDAILALRADHPLRSDRWREVPMTRATLALLVDRMRATRSDGPPGSVVLDDRGERIGVWLSWLPPLPVKLFDDGGVLVAPPDPRVDPLPPDKRHSPH